MALRTVGVKLAAEVSGYVSKLGQAKASTRELGQELDKAAQSGKLDAVADQAGAMGLALAAGFAVAAGAAAKFDKQMSEVAAVSDATGAELEQLRQAALKAGKDTAFSATQAAKAQAELAKAGLSTSEILGGALSGSLALAAAGSLDLAEAAEISAKTMNVFQLEGKDASHIADVLAAAANKSATDVHEMGEALKMGGLAANAAGMSLEETVGTLAAFADRALAGSDGGTSLKTAIMMLQAPTEKSAKLMDELGIAAYDANGNFVGTAKLAGNLQQALGGLTQEQRNAALATIFGADGMRAANILYEVGEKGIREYTAAVDDQGAAADVAAKKMDNLAGDLEKLKGSLETMAIEAGSGANGGLRQLVQAANAVVDQFASLPSAVSGTVVVLAGVAGAALLMAAGWIKARRATADAVTELQSSGPAGQRAARGLEATTKWAGRAAAAFVAVELAATAVRATAGDKLNPQIEALTGGLENWATTGQKSGEAARLLGKDFEHLAYDLKTIDGGFWNGLGNGIAGFVEGLTGLGSVADESLEKARERLSAIDSALSQMVQSGNGEEAARIFAKLAEEAKKQGVGVDELKAGLPGYAAALETAGKASQDTAGKVGEVGTAAGDAAEDVEALQEAFDTLFDIQMSADEALIKYHQGLKDLNEELGKGKKTLSVNSEEGRKNRSAVLEQIEAIKSLRDSRIAEGTSVDEANAKYGSHLTALRKSMLQAGYTKGEVDELIGSYQEIPKKVNTAVTANTKQAKNAAKDLREYLKNIPDEVVNIAMRVTGTKNASAAAAAIRKQYANRWGNVHHAESGLLNQAATWGPGDTLYAFREPATRGEAFIPKNGDMDRSRAIWEYVGENWLGARAARPVVAAAGSQRMNLDVRLVAGQGQGPLQDLVRAMMPHLRVEVVNRYGGRVERALVTG
ncbi:phage tail tape measure protein [Micromonosporaceae bacterium B7E4]